MGKFCKKAAMAVAVMMAAVSCFALPQFDGAFVFVRDGLPDKAGKVSKKPPKGQIRLVNASEETITNAISVYGYFKPLSSWTLIGGVESLNASADVTVKCSDEYPLSHYTAIAVRVDGMTAEVEPIRYMNDVCVNIKSVADAQGATPAKPKMNNAVLCYGDGAEDYIKPSNLGEKPMTLRVWGFNKKQAEWVTLCTTADLAPGEARKEKTEYKGKLDKFFEAFAVYETSNVKIECRAEELHNDLCLWVSVSESKEDDAQSSSSGVKEAAPSTSEEVGDEAEE